MTQTIAVTQKYGAIELKAVAQKYMMIGIVAASIMSFAFIGSYYLIGWLTEEEEPVRMVRLMKYSDLGPPPSLSSQAAILFKLQKK